MILIYLHISTTDEVMFCKYIRRNNIINIKTINRYILNK